MLVKSLILAGIIHLLNESSENKTAFPQKELYAPLFNVFEAAKYNVPL